MKKYLLTFFLILNSYTFSQSYPHITELRGLEDSVGNTHLFYRHLYPFTGCWSKSIYHFDLLTNLDTLFISDFGYEVFPGWGCEGDYVYDYEFFSNDPSKFIYCGYDLWIDPVALLRRYDGDIHIETFVLTELEISKLNENLVYVSAGPGFFKSTDGGYNFEFNDSSQLIDASIISLSHNNDSHIYGINDYELVRSENDGLNYFTVDNSYWADNSELFYDVDGEHIYGFSSSYNYQLHSFLSYIYVSDDNGNPFTWNNILEFQGKLSFTNDQIHSGEIYYSVRNKIFKSIDFGNTFDFYKQLDRNITGLYKKPGTEILYASTPLKIYEITPDTIRTIKSLPIPEAAFAWFPLNLEDKWVYNNTFYGDLGDSSRWLSTFDVVDYKVVQNKVYNKILVTEIPIDSSSPSGNHDQYFRVDSSKGKVYLAGIENDSLLFEELYMDLLAEVGDTIPVGNRIFLANEEQFTIFGLDSRKRTFHHTQTPVQDIELVNGLGLIYEYLWELVGIKKVLKGCIIDGIVYGDTTVVSVKDQETPVTSTFKLEQNYPNPFNPSTKIKFTIPNVKTHSDASLQKVTLKIYDILGSEIATLVNEELSAGEYEVEFNATKLPSGIYFYQLKAGSYIQTKKMIYIK